VDVSLEFRSADDAEFDQLDATLLALAREQAKRFGLELKADFRGRHSPTPMSASVQQAFADSCDALGLTHTSLVSGAGHDGQSFAGVCPMGMIFVPSVNGTSHSPHEFTKWDDCVNGANVLLQAALRLAQ
jgi:acetylornithine deacetylase/succinyl-diaminopimelate desuccinylase-like protein